MNLLRWSEGLVGIAAIFVNQLGGRWSDSVGRRLFFLLGPLMNVANGLVMFRNTGSANLLMVSRVFKMVFTTQAHTQSDVHTHKTHRRWSGLLTDACGYRFSSTVMLTAALMDTCSGACAHTTNLSLRARACVSSRLLIDCV